MIKIYGSIVNLKFTDTSKTERGAKCYATRHGHEFIGYRLGYTAITTHRKIKGRWIKCRQ